ncbi:MAG: GGDEF domain-containing protein [Lachnospiraceae bacterium]|nr:GGDEF domain-containing protein [Lachnospiraceae bacterium]
MTSFYHTVRQVFNGTRAINAKFKYILMGISIALIHLFFMLSFYSFHIRVLFLYNMAITIFYFYLSAVVAKKERYESIFISAFIEILFHSSMASILLGWNWGFMIYTIALVPVVFYLTYTLPYFKGSVFVPITASTIVCVCYISIKVVTNHIPPMYDTDLPEKISRFFNYFNTMVAFVMQMFCSILFALEIRYMKRQLEEENRTLGEIASHDPLTHLLNRRSMNSYLKIAIERSIDKQPFCLVLADIDNFKQVNDTYGHDCGDEVLIAVAEVISGNVREKDYVCRWGGEEILILLQADLETAVQVADRIGKDVASTVVKSKDKEVSVTVTMGVSQYDQGATIRSLIDEADQNLYYGKKHGKNQVVTSATNHNAE